MVYKVSGVFYINFYKPLSKHKPMKYSKLEEIHPELSHGKIEKKVMLKKGDVSNLMMFNWAKIKPGEYVESHKHDNMYEIFYGLSGKLRCVVDKKTINLEKGDCLVVNPNEAHAFNNPSKKDAVFLCYGIAVNVDDFRY